MRINRKLKKLFDDNALSEAAYNEALNDIETYLEKRIDETDKDNQRKLNNVVKDIVDSYIENKGYRLS